MKLSAVFGAAVLLIKEAAAADCAQMALTNIPTCAHNCFFEGGPAIGCAALDYSCQCDQEAALYATIEECVAISCQSAQYQGVIDGVESVCNCAQNVFVIQGRGTVGSYSPTVSSYPSSVTATATVTQATSKYAPTTAAPTASPSPSQAGAANLRAAAGLAGGIAAAAILI